MRSSSDIFASFLASFLSAIPGTIVDSLFVAKMRSRDANRQVARKVQRI